MGINSNFGVEYREPNTINWADISKGFTDTINTEQKARADKKAAIDQASSDFKSKISNIPLGDNSTINQFWINAAGAATDAVTTQDQLLKSGNLKLNDYLAQRQNTNDGVNSLINITKNWQDQYAKKMARMNSGVSSDAEGWLMGQIEQFQNFDKTALVVDKATGNLKLAPKETNIVNGQEVSTPTDDKTKHLPISALIGAFNSTYDHFDVDKNVKAMTDNWGEQKKVIINTAKSAGLNGTVTEVMNTMLNDNLPINQDKLDELYKQAVEDKQNPFRGSKEQWLENFNNLKAVTMKFEDAETQALNSQLTNKWNVQSILKETKGIAPNGNPYDYTLDPKERDKNPNLILFTYGAGNQLEPDFTGAIGQKQFNDARETLRLHARLQYDDSQTLKQTIDPPTPHYSSGGGRSYNYRSSRTSKGATETPTEALSEETPDLFADNIIKNINPEWFLKKKNDVTTPLIQSVLKNIPNLTYSRSKFINNDIDITYKDPNDEKNVKTITINSNGDNDNDVNTNLFNLANFLDSLPNEVKQYYYKKQEATQQPTQPTQQPTKVAPQKATNTQNPVDNSKKRKVPVVDASGKITFVLK